MLLPFILLTCSFILPVTSSPNGCQSLCEDKSYNCHSILFGESCFFCFDGVKRSWNDTKYFCSEQNMTISQLPTTANDSYIGKLWRFAKGTGVGDAWLGGRSVDLGSWTFINDHHLNLTEFGSPEVFNDPSSFHKCGVAASRIKEGKREYALDVVPCYEEHHYLCRKASRYKQSRAKAKNWFGAREKCQDLGGHLFYAKDGESVSQLLKENIASQRNDDRTFFIGLRHQTWQWQDGSDTITSNENVHGSDSSERKCLMLRDETIIATSCGWRSQVICQKAIPQEESTTVSAAAQKEQNEYDTSISPITIQDRLGLNATETERSPRSSLIMAYIGALTSIFAGPLFLVWIFVVVLLVRGVKCRKNEEALLEGAENIYCDVDPSGMKTDFNVNNNHQVAGDSVERSGSETRIPFYRISADDVIVIENHLYGTTEDVNVEDRQGVTNALEDELTADDETVTENHLYGSSEDCSVKDRQDVTRASEDEMTADDETVTGNHLEGSSEDTVTFDRCRTIHCSQGKEDEMIASDMAVAYIHLERSSEDAVVFYRCRTIHCSKGKDDEMTAGDVTVMENYLEGNLKEASVESRHKAAHATEGKQHEMVADGITLVNNHLYGTPGDDAPKKKCSPTDLIALKPIMPEVRAGEVIVGEITPLDHHLYGTSGDDFQGYGYGTAFKLMTEGSHEMKEDEMKGEGLKENSEKEDHMNHMKTDYVNVRCVNAKK